MPVQKNERILLSKKYYILIALFKLLYHIFPAYSTCFYIKGRHKYKQAAHTAASSPAKHFNPPAALKSFI